MSITLRAQITTLYSFAGLAKNMGRKMTRYAIYDIYQHYKEKVFPTLLTNPNIPFDEKSKIQTLLDKPWNPYIHRHSVLTMKAQDIKGTYTTPVCRMVYQFNMPQKYLHYFGNEASESPVRSIWHSYKRPERSDLVRSKAMS